MSDNNPETILFRFASCISLINGITNKHFDSPIARQNEQMEIIKALRELDKDIDASDTFSPNELWDDIITTNLKYLLVPYFLGEFLLQSSTGYAARDEQLKEVKIVFKKFIDRLDLLMVITSDQRKLLDGAQLGPAELRSRRIAEFKREKTLMPLFYDLQQKWTKFAINDFKNQLNVDDTTIGAGKQLQIEGVTQEQLLDGEVCAEEREVMQQVLDRCVDKIVTYNKQVEEELQILAFHKKEQEQRLLEAKQPGGGDDAAARQRQREQQQRGTSSRPLHMHTISEDAENRPVKNIPVPFLNANTTMGATNSRDMTQEEYEQLRQQEQDQQQQANRPSHVHVSTSGVSSGGLRVHQYNSSDDVKAPVPQHMKDFMIKPNPAATQATNKTGGAPHTHSHGGHACNQSHNADGTPHQHTAACRHAHQLPIHQKKLTRNDVMSEEERLAKPWFNAQAGSTCECCYEDVTQLPDYVMSSKAKGRQGKLVKMCPTHKVGVDVCGCGEAKGNTDMAQKDRIGDFVAMKTDRSRVFRDRNPYLMELDDFAKMKIESGELPGIKDRQLADKIKTQEELHRLRVEAGDSDDEDQKMTQREIDEQEDAAQMKAREWADYTDDHQKGAGNKKYRK